MSLYAVTVTGEALAASAVETLVLVRAGTTRKAKLRRWGISFNGTNVTDSPVQVQLLRINSDGSSSAATAIKLDESNPDTPNLSFRTSFTAEPTTGNVLESHFITPAGGLLVETYFDDAPVIAMDNRLAIRVLGNNAVNASVFLHVEE